MRDLSRRLKRHTTAAACLFALVVLAGAAVDGQLGNDIIELEHPAFNYGAPARRNAVTRLSDRLAAGQVSLKFDRGSGYLRSLLQELAVPIESQITVFSAASLQSRLIRPSNPRAIFFNDSVTVGWVRGGFIEIAAHDVERGAVFFRLMQIPGLPTLFRENGCLSCHYSATTLGVPGFIARSIPTAVDGSIMPWLGNYQVDHRTPLSDRWGGWYVTGRVGSPHLGNTPLADRRLQELRPAVVAPPLESLTGRFDTELFLSPHSDVVALLVFDHQQHMMNLLSRISAEARVRPDAPLDEAAAEVVDYMLFVDEAPMGPVAGASGFAKVFSAGGPRDSKGRSLRDLDLTRRLMRYPCSYMIYSEAFDGLPAAAKGAIYKRLKDVLEGRGAAPRYSKLSAADRQAVLEILRETKRDFAG
jgi:hypothetical protein